MRHLSNISALWPIVYLLSTKKKIKKKKKFLSHHPFYLWASYIFQYNVFVNSFV